MTAKQWLGRVWSSLKNFQKNSRLASQTIILALDIALLAAKLFKAIPRVVEHGSLVLLNFVGLLSVDDMLREIAKMSRDFCYAYQSRTFTMMAYSALKVCVQVTDLCLLLSMAATAVVGLLGYTRYTPYLYKCMVPIGLVSFGIGMGLQVVDWHLSQRLWRDLSAIQNEERLVIAEAFKQLVLNPAASAKTCPPLARRLIWQMDAYSLAAYRQQLGAATYIDDGQALYRQLLSTIDYRRVQHSGSLGLLIFGYLSRALCKAYPNSLLQSCIVTLNALLYWLKEVHAFIHHGHIARGESMAAAGASGG